LRRRILSSPLLSSLADQDVDRLVSAATPERFAAGERIVDAAREDRDLLLLVEGTAGIVLIDERGTVKADEMRAGEMLGLVRPKGVEGEVRIVAVSDCEVVRVEAETAALAVSANTGVSTALNQLIESRMRRIERLASSRSVALEDGQ
jgi:CRP-like cAMP-binding protein